MGAVSLVQILLQQGVACFSWSWLLLVEGWAKTKLVVPNCSPLHIWWWLHNLFLDDQWFGPILKHVYPRIASYSRSESISVFDVMQAEDLDTLFFLPLSQQALEELEQLQNHLQDIPYDEHSRNRWTPTWGNSYTSKRFYSYIFGIVEAHPIFKEVWKSGCTSRIKFFAWLVLVDRLNTKTMLTRRHLHVHDDDFCVMCETREEETIEHLFFTCPFASQCWASINFV